MNDSDLVSRAIRAERRFRARHEAAFPAPNDATADRWPSAVAEVGPRRYVQLRNQRGTIAVYRVGPSGRIGRRLDEAEPESQRVVLR